MKKITFILFSAFLFPSALLSIGDPYDSMLENLGKLRSSDLAVLEERITATGEVTSSSGTFSYFVERPNLSPPLGTTQSAQRRHAPTQLRIIKIPTHTPSILSPIKENDEPIRSGDAARATRKPAQLPLLFNPSLSSQAHKPSFLQNIVRIFTGQKVVFSRSSFMSFDELFDHFKTDLWLYKKRLIPHTWNSRVLEQSRMPYMFDPLRFQIAVSDTPLTIRPWRPVIDDHAWSKHELRSARSKGPIYVTRHLSERILEDDHPRTKYVEETLDTYLGVQLLKLQETARRLKRGESELTHLDLFPAYTTLSLFDHEKGKLAGCIVFGLPDEKGLIDLSIILAPAYRGKGYGSKLLTHLVDFLPRFANKATVSFPFTQNGTVARELPFRGLKFETDVHNTPSLHLAARMKTFNGITFDRSLETGEDPLTFASVKHTLSSLHPEESREATQKEKSILADLLSDAPQIGIERLREEFNAPHLKAPDTSVLRRIFAME